MAIQPFFDSIKRLEILVQVVLSDMFPSNRLEEVLQGITEKKTTMVTDLIFRGIDAGSELVLEFIASTSGIDIEQLKHDTDIGVGGLGEIIATVLEVNGFEDFFNSALPAVKNVWQCINEGNKTKIEEKENQKI